MTLDIDTLAQEIRRVDGNHSLGAGALAEALMPFLRSYIESHTGEVLAHEWHERFGLTCCKICGFVRNENSDAKGCRGPVYVSLRDVSPVQPVKLEWAGHYDLIWNDKRIGHVEPGVTGSDGWRWKLLESGWVNHQTAQECRVALESTARQWLSGGDK